jgi:hypothetical protein
VLACAAVASCGGGGGGGGGNPPVPLSLAAATLDDGVVGASYAQTLATTGGRAPIRFALSGSLPPGLTLGMNGRITGTVAGPPGTSSFTITATDSSSNAQSDTQDFSIRVAEPIAVDAGDPPMAVVGQPYSHPINVSGGTPPYEIFASMLPSGLAIDADGLVSGTPDAEAVTVIASMTARDAASPRQELPFNLHLPVRLEVVTTALPDASGGVAYSARLESHGGLPDLHWDITGGTGPFAVSSDGRVTGTAATTCTVAHETLDVRVADLDTPAQSADRTGITIDVVPRDVQVPATSAPPVGVVGAPYSQEIEVSPGVPPYTFALSGGSLPPGLALGAGNGRLTGVPTTAGTSTFTVLVTDDCGSTATASFSIIVRNVPTGRNDSIATATPIGNGIITASISPSGHPNSVFSPDEDYYRVQATAASTVTVDLDALGGGIDTVVEIVNAGGTRLQTCVAPAYVDACVSDDESQGNLDSFLQLRTAGAATFYIHVVEWRGDGRPDLQYRMEVSGVN